MHFVFGRQMLECRRSIRHPRECPKQIGEGFYTSLLWEVGNLSRVSGLRRIGRKVNYNVL